MFQKVFSFLLFLGPTTDTMEIITNTHIDELHLQNNIELPAATDRRRDSTVPDISSDPPSI